jgi:phosphoribosylformimino-5-aminoimidazole carboxamide ribotide isomerase
MLAIPRLEIRSGLAVQPAVSGNFDAGMQLGEPLGILRSLAHFGFARVHVVDADALAGTGTNADLIEDLVRDGGLEIQVADAADSADGIERFISAGAFRVVVGSRGLEERDWLAGVAEAYPGLLLVGTDVRERRVVTRGWVRTLAIDVLDLAAELNDLPIGGLLIHSGTGEAGRTLDLSLLEDIADASDSPVYAELFQATPSDLRALENRGIGGVLLGGSLYNGELDARHVALEFSE